ncbi:arylsulfatase [Desulfobaculum bizertense]|uniref:Arylsulfatase n=1 Tax=Desulfobaculum bizertense DSM 18034 TaxID=1121442 RepID=A0A1T4W7M9_9BACT|nr:arylsulfatase [Desulfobaculum bizertense]UIJ38998.1 arylsulfatase [Desulfobaculum bizertense]SKA72701.1 arylsulfatase [Desulfobaculum bizertense DSM 18034]
MRKYILFFLLFCSIPFCAYAKDPVPNIIVIFTDDVGVSNVSAYHRGLMSSQTPHIDSIAKHGMLFTDYYAQPSCTAGRSAFLTGQYPVRTGLHTVGLPGSYVGLTPDTPTLAEVLKTLGYTTGQFGKNHLGDRDEFLPTMHGFDEYWGWLYHLNAMEYTIDPDWPAKNPQIKKFTPRNLIHSWSTGKGTQKIEDDGPLPPERMKTLDDEVNKHAFRFIRDAVENETPFFVWYCPSRGHVWTHLSSHYEAMLGQNGWGLQEVVMKELDDHIGELLQLLEELKIKENTIVVFTADNGPEIMTWPDGGMSPFHGEKGSTWEGGVRAPMLISWPAQIPAGTINNGIFDGMDFFPTLVAAAGGPQDMKKKMKEGYKGFKAHLDGYNQLETLTQGQASKRTEIIYYERDQLQAVRYNDWKAHFIVQRHGWAGPKEQLNAPLLYNLRRDPFERAADESGMYLNWMGKKMWTFGPIQEIVRRHLMTFKEWPPVSSVPKEQQQAPVDADGIGR